MEGQEKKYQELINTSPLTVKTHMSRALTSVRAYLKENKMLSVMFLYSFSLVCTPFKGIFPVFYMNKLCDK
jgi:hypothetical protein